MYGLIPFTATDPPEEKLNCLMSKTSTKDITINMILIVVVVVASISIIVRKND